MKETADPICYVTTEKTAAADFLISAAAV